MSNPKERDRLGTGIVSGPLAEAALQQGYLAKPDGRAIGVTRAFGDLDFEDFGIHSVPEVRHYDLQPQDKALILGSDGFWEEVSHQCISDAVRTCSSSSDCVTVLREALGSPVDDASFVVVFFKDLVQAV